MADWIAVLQKMEATPWDHTYEDAALVLSELKFVCQGKETAGMNWWYHEASGARVGLLKIGDSTLPPDYITTMLKTLTRNHLIP